MGVEERLHDVALNLAEGNEGSTGLDLGRVHPVLVVRRGMELTVVHRSRKTLHCAAYRKPVDLVSVRVALTFEGIDVLKPRRVRFRREPELIDVLNNKVR